MGNTAEFGLTPEIAALVTNALDTGNVLLLAAVDRDRKPVLSFRGSTAVFSDTQLSFWARNAGGGTLDAISENPHVAFMYRSQSVPLLQFIGRGRITDVATERNRVFDLAHEKERASDPQRKGRAVIVDLDEVKGVLGFNKDGPIFIHPARSQP
jgi:Pyridoxamine 5'-phosphate oxidase